jgi:hypothetical protein
MDIDPTQPIDKEAQKFVILCGINPVDGKSYPLTINPTTGELKVGVPT